MTIRRIFSLLRLRPMSWIALGLLTLMVKGIFSLAPQLCEKLYSRGLFLVFRWVWDHTLALMPFPLLWLILASLPAYWLLRRQQKRKHNALRERIPHRGLRALLNALGFVGFASFTFQWMWAFHYQRLPVAEVLQLDAQPLDEEAIRDEFAFATQQLLASRLLLGDTTLPYDALWSSSPADAKVVREKLSTALEICGYPTPGRVRIKAVYPPGALMYFGANGIYLPWAGESYYPADLPTCHLPFLTAHEMAHGYGFADEGTANFWAYVACHTPTASSSSYDAPLHYSADLHYWKYVAREMYKVDTLAYSTVRRTLPKGIQLDLLAERQHGEKYDTWFSGFSFRAYNSYLKSQGVRDGYTSYSRIVCLVRAWRKSFNPAVDNLTN